LLALVFFLQKRVIYMLKKILWLLVLIGGVCIMQWKTLAENKVETATFAGGCFWCMEASFEKTNGVVDVVSGYTGGTGANPTYEDYGKKGYLEAIQITYNPAKITYE